MKKKLCMIILIFSGLFVFAYDFQEFYWGTSMDYVIEKKGEPDTIIENENGTTSIFYDVTIGETPYQLSFFFTDTGLDQAYYLFKGDVTNGFVCYNEYRYLGLVLTIKYGNKYFSSEDILDSGAQKAGDIILSGKDAVIATWKKGNTDTTMWFQGTETNTGDIRIIYSPIIDIRIDPEYLSNF